MDMQVRWIPHDDPAEADQIAAMLAENWRCIPGIMLRSLDGGQIALPGRPPPMGPRRVDVWYQPVPSVPIQVLAEIMFGLLRQGADPTTMDGLSRSLFRLSLAQLQERFLGEPDDHPDSDRSNHSGT